MADEIVVTAPRADYWTVDLYQNFWMTGLPQPRELRAGDDPLKYAPYPVQQPPATAPEPPKSPAPPPAELVVTAKPLPQPPPSSFSFVGPAPYAPAPFAFIPQVETLVVRAKRSLVGRLLSGATQIAARASLGLFALLWPRQLNIGEKEFLDAFYARPETRRARDARRPADDSDVPTLEVTATRLPRGFAPVGPGGAALLLPAREPRIDRTRPRTPDTRLAIVAEPEIAPRPAPAPPARRPPPKPIAPAAPLDPDEDWPEFPTPRRIRLPRPRFPWPEIGPDVLPEPLIAPLPAPAPGREARPSPVPWGRPAPSPFATPLGDPYASPTPFPTPGPATRPGVRPRSPGPSPVRAPRVPSPFTPGPALFAEPGLTPMPSTPATPARPSNCPPCEQTKDKKKKKRSKQPRMVCGRGSYVERSKGLIKHPKEIIPCR